MPVAFLLEKRKKARMATAEQALEAAPQQTASPAEPSPTPTIETPAPVLTRAQEKAALLEQMTNPTPEPEPEPETPEVPKEAPVIEEPGEEDPGDMEPEPELGKPAAKNLRVHVEHLDAKERRVMELTGKKGLSLEEAYRAVYGTSPGQQQAKEPLQDPVAAVELQIVDGEKQIEELETKIAEASYDPDAQTALRKQQRDLIRKVGQLEEKKENIAVQQKSGSQKQAEDAYQASFQQALSDYPDAYVVNESNQADFNKKTRIGQLAAAEDRLLRSAKNPIVDAPDYHEFLLARVAATIGIQPTSTPAAPTPVAVTKQPVPQAAPKRGVRPVVTGGIEPSEPDAAKELEAATRSSDPQVLLAMLGKYGTQF